ncbi:MAG: histidine phosphatase family protein [Gemmataceae bacterium]|nr:histidine phosphatase family protein [Gemmataceae bacterium]
MDRLTTFFFLRHAEAANPDVYHGAESDVSLGPRGIEQAERVAQFLAEKKITRLVSSGMKRARETALRIAAACNLEIEIQPRLHERRVGTLSGTVNNLPDGPWRKTLNRWQAGEINFAPEGSESFADIRNRVVPIWEDLAARHAGERVAVVAHGTVLKVLYLTLLPEWSVSDWDKMGVIPNVGVTEFNGEGKTWKAECLNLIPPKVLLARPPVD